jgi:hypothetical protein
MLHRRPAADVRCTSRGPLPLLPPCAAWVPCHYSCLARRGRRPYQQRPTPAALPASSTRDPVSWLQPYLRCVRALARPGQCPAPPCQAASSLWDPARPGQCSAPVLGWLWQGMSAGASYASWLQLWMTGLHPGCMLGHQKGPARTCVQAACPANVLADSSMASCIPSTQVAWKLIRAPEDRTDGCTDSRMYSRMYPLPVSVAYYCLWAQLELSTCSRAVSSGPKYRQSTLHPLRAGLSGANPHAQPPSQLQVCRD